MHRILIAAALSACALVAATSIPAAPKQASFAQQLRTVHDATAKYANGLDRAKADGYQILTKMIPDMGYHFMNPKIQGFNLAKPPILVYEHSGSTWRLGAVEWVFPAKPKTPPVAGAKYGSFPAACQYKDGTFVPAAAQSQCAMTAPGSGAAFTFWHPQLVTMHIWAWYPNPLGVFSGINPLARPYDKG
jgi:hypothetical protein